jgi:hypothetical protein
VTLLPWPGGPGRLTRSGDLVTELQQHAAMLFAGDRSVQLPHGRGFWLGQPFASNALARLSQLGRKAARLPPIAEAVCEAQWRMRTATSAPAARSWSP